MDRVPIAPGPLWFVEKRDIGLRHIGMDILQTNTHGPYGDGEILEAGQQVEKMVGVQGKFGGLDTVRGEF